MGTPRVIRSTALSRRQPDDGCAMRKLLIVYASRYGHSEKVARRIAEFSGVDANVIDVRRVSAAHFAACDAVIVVAPVYYGRHLKVMRRFVTENRERLASLKSAFVSVSGSAGDPAKRSLADDFVRELANETGWTPSQQLIVGGAITFTKYNPLLRWILKRSFAREGKPLDSSRDYDFTDWNEVAQFARDFVAGKSTKVA